VSSRAVMVQRLSSYLVMRQIRNGRFIVCFAYDAIRSMSQYDSVMATRYFMPSV